MLAFLHSFTGMALAFVLGTAIGFERQWRQRNAGLRTNLLVAVGSAAFADLGHQVFGAEGAVRVISYVVSGIGFLGAGVILKDGTNIRGLNTAATLWCSAAVGCCAGAGFSSEACALTVMVLAGNTLLRPLTAWIDRHPLGAGATEARYRIHITVAQSDANDARDLLEAVLDKARVPARQIDIAGQAGGLMDLVAELLPTSLETEELDAVVADLEKASLIRSATWTIGVTG